MNQLVPQWGINEPGWAASNAAGTHKALGSCAGSVCIRLCCCPQTQGNHRAHTAPTPHLTRGQENSQQNRAGTEMMEELEKGTHCWLHLTDSCQMSAADGFWGTWISLLAGNPSLLLSMDTKPVWELNCRKTINENKETCSTSDWALQPYNAVSQSERNTKWDRQTHSQIFIVTHCCAEGWGKPHPLLC